MNASAQRFEELRPRLMRVAYSHLGSITEAEDVVQEAWLRFRRADEATIDDLRAWLTTVVSRLALDALGSARARRERYVGPWLPEPLVEAAAGVADPADRVTLDESVSLALLFVLKRLSPAERTAFVLHDVFGYAFDEIGEVVGRTPAAARQLASRARRHVVEGDPRQSGTPEQQRRAVEAFASAAGGGDLDALLEVLDPDVVMRSDGGGRVQASRVPLIGADRVSRALVALARTYAGQSDAHFVDVNGLPGLLMVTRNDGHVSVLGFTVNGEQITTIHIPHPAQSGEAASPGRGGQVDDVTGRGVLRIVLASVGVANVLTGLTALLTPRGFYDDFPFGAGWVALLPPYNEHLATDVGAFFLAFGLLLGYAAFTLARELVLPVCAAWTIFALAHLAFHLTHLDGMSSAEAVAQSIGLVAVLAPVVVAVAVLRREHVES